MSYTIDERVDMIKHIKKDVDKCKIRLKHLLEMAN